MKFDQTTAHAKPRDAILSTCFGNAEHRFLIGASTHPGEEKLLLQTFVNTQDKHPDLRLILAPRHHERTPEVIQLIQSFDLTYACLTDLENNTTVSADKRQVLLINTTGELVNFFPNADIVYMGKTLCNNTGGHNIIEPALFAKPIVHGPHMENFRKVAACFQNNQATIQVNHEAELETAIDRLLTSPKASNALGNRAYQTVQDNRGATETTITLITELLPTC
jgi:3-deoxy-D-manno-octulosonic-acid transferase